MILFHTGRGYYYRSLIIAKYC